MSITNNFRVVVIGAGAIGVSVAAELAERGGRVTLLDATSPGAGTSGLTYAWLNSNGKEPEAYFEINRLGLAAHKQLAGHGSYWLGEDGHIEVAADPVHAEHLAARVQSLQRRGYGAEFISADRALQLEPSLRDTENAELIAFFSEETYLYPALYIAHQLGRLRANGGEIVSGITVTEITETGSGTRVRGSDGVEFTADALVSAVGRQTSEIAALLGEDVPLVEYKEPGDPTVGYLAETIPVPIDVRRMVTTSQLNFRPNGGGRLLLQALDLDAGAAAEMSEISSDISAEFADRLARVVAGGEYAEVESIRVGRRVLPADGLTVAGRIGKKQSVYVVATHSGITLAPFLAAAIADELGGCERPELAAFRPGRFRHTNTQPTVSAPRIAGQQ